MHQEGASDGHKVSASRAAQASEARACNLLNKYSDFIQPGRAAAPPDTPPYALEIEHI